MSTPDNPLNKYRTSSFFHVLVVCDSSTTAQTLTSGGALNLHNVRDPTTRLVPQTTTPTAGAPAGKYVVLIDGSTDAQFVIQEASWNTILTSNVVTGQGTFNSSCAYSEGSLTIHEPYGVRFLDVLAQVCQVLNTDPIGLIFVLKTYFVGQFDDGIGAGAQDVITNIRPFWFSAIDIQAHFSETGATYSLDFVGSSNGASKLPQVNTIASSVSIPSYTFDAPGKGTTVTLKDMFANQLPAVINRAVQNDLQARQSAAKQVGAPFDPNSARKYVYKFNLDPAYQSNKYLFGSNEQSFKQDKPGHLVLSLSGRPTIEQIIETIMLSSKEVVQEANSNTVKYQHRIHASITSTPTQFIVTYFINRVKVIQFNNASGQPSLPNPFPPPNSSIVFDYIFTGKNVDILDFDIKMELGLAFFSMLGTTKNFPSQQEHLHGIQKSQTNSPTGGAQGSMLQPGVNDGRPQSPATGGAAALDPRLRNKNDPVSTNNYMMAIARQAAIENVQAKLTIRGNPQILNEMNVTPNDLSNRTIAPDDPKKLGPPIAPNWLTTPIYVKINIMTPTVAGNPDFAEPFWYRGWFQILSVQNIFSADGTFKQELEMFSLPQSDLFSNVTTSSTQPASVGTATTAHTTNNANGLSRTPSDVSQSLAKTPAGTSVLS